MWLAIVSIGFIIGFVARVSDMHMRDCGASWITRTAVVVAAMAVAITLSATLIGMTGGPRWGEW